MMIFSLLVILGLFGLALFLFKALGWVIVTGVHVVVAILLAMVVWASILWWRKRLSGRS